jgi:hypothetical protein
VRAVYVPREINLGVTELRLEDCINVKDICDKELTKWTAEDVAKFVRATDCAEYAHVFVDQVSAFELYTFVWRENFSFSAVDTRSY